MKKQIKNLTEEDVKKLCKKILDEYDDCYKCPLYDLQPYGKGNCYLDLQELIKEIKKIEKKIEVEDNVKKD